jgi:hypothetical protein
MTLKCIGRASKILKIFKNVTIAFLLTASLGYTKKEKYALTLIVLTVPFT